MQELFSISVVQVCCKSVLGLGPVYCPKVNINHLEVNANLCRTSASSPVVTIKIQHINFYNIFFPFIPFLPDFLLPYSLQAGDGMKNGCSRAHHSPRNEGAAPGEHGSATRPAKCLRAECNDNSGSTFG